MMNATDVTSKREQAETIGSNKADYAEAMRGLSNADQDLDRLSADLIGDAEIALDDLLRQINDLGDDCPAEFRAARLEAEDALAEVRQTLSDASKTIASLGKHLKSLS